MSVEKKWRFYIGLVVGGELHNWVSRRGDTIQCGTALWLRRKFDKKKKQKRKEVEPVCIHLHSSSSVNVLLF
jgi:hypothetical protein